MSSRTLANASPNPLQRRSKRYKIYRLFKYMLRNFFDVIKNRALLATSGRRLYASYLSEHSANDRNENVNHVVSQEFYFFSD
jgi:hypothetical protein